MLVLDWLKRLKFAFSPAAGAAEDMRRMREMQELRERESASRIALRVASQPRPMDSDDERSTNLLLRQRHFETAEELKAQLKAFEKYKF